MEKEQKMENNQNRIAQLKKELKIEELKERIEKLKFQRDIMCIDGYAKPFYTKRIIELTKELERIKQ